MDDRDDPGAYTPEEAERLRRIEEELERVRGTEFAEPGESGLDNQVEEIQERARRARRAHSKHTPEGSTGMITNPEDSRNLGKGMQVAYAIIGLPLVGAGLGWVVDQGLHTTFGVMTGVLLGAVGGIGFAVMVSNRQ